MHIPTHILSGWCVGNALPFTPRERLFCMIAATVADVDGLGIVFGQRFYHDYHHVVGHNLLFAVVVSLLLAGFSTRPILGVFAYLGLTHLHLLMDYYGSGPGWPICYTWPFDRSPEACWMNPHAWEFFSWQNIAAGYALLGVTVVIALLARRTPLELLMPSLERRLTGKGHSGDNKWTPP